MTRDELIKKVGICNDLSQEVYEEGILNVKPSHDGIQCDLEGLKKIAGDSPIKCKRWEGWKLYGDESCEYRATTRVEGMMFFALCSKKEVEEIKKATCEVAK